MSDTFIPDIKLDEVYDTVDILSKKGYWSILDTMLLDLAFRVWRVDIDILMGYLTATLPVKDKIPAREYLLSECKRMRRETFWDGIE